MKILEFFLDKFFRKNINSEFEAYFNAGLAFGKAVSLLGCIGKLPDFEQIFYEWKKQEKMYLEKGYEPISIDDFADCAAYGIDIEHLKYKTAKSKILHADIFEIFWLHEEYIGNAFVALERQQPVVGTWIFPTTRDHTIQKKYREVRDLFPTEDGSKIKSLYLKQKE